jgi:hypothetical protein
MAAGRGPAAALVTPDLVAEAAETLRAATRGGLQMERSENLYGPVPSLEDIVARMIDTRDVRLALHEEPDPGLDAMHEARQEFEELAARVQGGGRGPRHVRAQIRALRRLGGIEDPAEAFAILKDALADRAQRRDFSSSDRVTWWLYKTLTATSGAGDHPPDLGERLRGPYRWLAARRAPGTGGQGHVRPGQEGTSSSTISISWSSCAILRDDRRAATLSGAVPAHLRRRVQDTDPSSARSSSICEKDGAEARDWGDAALPGRLTRRSKQSIYTSGAPTS